MNTQKAENWELWLNDIIISFRSLKRYQPINGLGLTIFVHKFPIQKLLNNKDWIIEYNVHGEGTYSVAKPKDPQLEGLYLFK